MKKKLKIGIFFSSNASLIGGVQQQVLYLSKELLNKGHIVRVFGVEKNRLAYPNYTQLGYSIPISLPNGNYGNFTILDKKKLNEINENDFDLFHIHEPYVPFMNLMIINKFKSIPKIATFHTAWNDESINNLINPFISFFKKFFSKNFKAAIFVSNITKKRWENLCDKKVIKKVIYNGIDRNFKPIKKIESDNINLLYVARIVKRKGLKYLLKALEILKKDFKIEKNIFLTVIGEGPERKKLEEYVIKKKLGKLVKFKGEVFNKEKIKYFQQADIFCAPYFDESFGLTIIEAMACGTPVIGFKNESFNEIIKNKSYQQFFVKPRDVKALSFALYRVIQEKKIRKKLSILGVKATKGFFWDNLVDKVEDLYYKVKYKKNESNI